MNLIIHSIATTVRDIHRGSSGTVRLVEYPENGERIAQKTAVIIRRAIVSDINIICTDWDGICSERVTATSGDTRRLGHRRDLMDDTVIAIILSRLGFRPLSIET
jgi:hypothetical protein